MIQVRGLWKTYGKGANQVDALRGVDLDVANGEFVAIVGPSGSGKSTLLNLLGTLDTPTRGELTVAGHRLDQMTEMERTEFRRRDIGFAFQFFNLLPLLNARENIALPLLLAGKSRREANQVVQGLLERVSLLERANHKPDELSGGEMQRVAVARALAANPKVILADEPTGNLDTVTGAKVLHLLQEVMGENKRSLVMVTHNPQAAQYADRVITLADGKVTENVQAPRAATAD